jgi:hypothetical protein
LEKTFRNRPDLLVGAVLDAKEREWLAEMEKEKEPVR